MIVENNFTEEHYILLQVSRAAFSVMKKLTGQFKTVDI